MEGEGREREEPGTSVQQGETFPLSGSLIWFRSGDTRHLGQHSSLHSLTEHGVRETLMPNWPVLWAPAMSQGLC